MDDPNTQLRPLRPRVTIVSRKPSLDFSVIGLIYCTMMMFMGLAAINSQANLLFGVFGLMMGVLLVSGIISRLVLMHLQVKRSLPPDAIVGRPVNIYYELRNRKRFWPSMSVTLAELDGAEAFLKQPIAYIIHVAAGTNGTVAAEMTAKRRGLHQLDRYQVITSFPFGFVKRASDRRAIDSLLVYPAIGRVDKKVMQMCRPAESSGTTMRPRRGGTDEFYGIKSYRPGENPRWIYWRRSARTGTLLSKEMTHVSPPRVMLLVDTYLPDRSIESHAAVERVIAMAASVASQAMEQGLPVGILAWRTDAWLELIPNRGKRHRLDLLTALARLPLNISHGHRQLIDASYRHRKSGTTMVLLTASAMRASLGDTARGAMVVLSSTDPATDSLFQFERSVDFASSMPWDQQPK